MKVCILGGDGYLGWPTGMYFSARGHDVLLIDNCVKRRLEADLEVLPLEEVLDFELRAAHWNNLSGRQIQAIRGDIYTTPDLLLDVCDDFHPDVIVHYAEQPSAPYSMMDRDAAVFTQANNVIGNLNVIFGIRDHCPDAHLIKLGTMGEYGTPNIDIEEGWIEITHKMRKDRMLFPKSPASLYHCSKVHDSVNLEFGCRSWGLRVTDLNQGVVYGIETDEMRLEPQLLGTSFHYDDIFGTVLNRFVVQAAIGVPLTVYGKGGQTRGYLNIKDTLQCVELAALHPAAAGEFRVFNQFTESFSVSELAERVMRVAQARGLSVRTDNIPNPRVEKEAHYYNPVHTALLDLGLKPHLLSDELIGRMLERATASRSRVRESSILPRLNWKRGAAKKVTPVKEPVRATQEELDSVVPA